MKKQFLILYKMQQSSYPHIVYFHVPMNGQGNYSYPMMFQSDNLINNPMCNYMNNSMIYPMSHPIQTQIQPPIQSTIQEIPKSNKRKSIPKRIKDMVWEQSMGQNKAEGPCFCCKKIINITDYHCSHIISVSNRGSDTLENLKPLCAQCNLSMGTMNMYDFIIEYGLWYSEMTTSEIMKICDALNLPKLEDKKHYIRKILQYENSKHHELGLLFLQYGETMNPELLKKIRKRLSDSSLEQNEPVKKSKKDFHIELGRPNTMTVKEFLDQYFKIDELNRSIDMTYVNNIVEKQIEYYQKYQDFYYPDSFLLHFDEALILYKGQHRYASMRILLQKGYHALENYLINYHVVPIRDVEHRKMLFKLSMEPEDGSTNQNNASLYMDHDFLEKQIEKKEKIVKSNIPTHITGKKDYDSFSDVMNFLKNRKHLKKSKADFYESRTCQR